MVSGARRRAFTLVELLAVVGIIALLVAMLMPSLRRAVVLARRAVCLVRLSNFSDSMHNYAADSNGYVIPCRFRSVQIALNPKIGDSGDDAVDWVAQARKLGLEEEAVECPDRPGSYEWEAGFPQMILGYQYFGGIRTWKNPWGSFPARSPNNFNTAEPDWVLAADCMMKIDQVWGGGRETAYGHMPVHRWQDPWPEGGNHVRADSSGTWVDFKKTVFIHTWGGWNRIAYFYQEDLGDFEPPEEAKAKAQP